VFWLNLLLEYSHEFFQDRSWTSQVIGPILTTRATALTVGAYKWNMYFAWSFRGWRKLHDKELHKLYSSPNINGMIKNKNVQYVTLKFILILLFLLTTQHSGFILRIRQGIFGIGPRMQLLSSKKKSFQRMQCNIIVPSMPSSPWWHLLRFCG